MDTVLQQEIEQASLVDDHVRELGEAIAHILHTAEPGDPCLVIGIRPPEVGSR